jgi:glycerate-2-kinase
MKLVGKRISLPELPVPAPTPDELEQIAAGMVQLAKKRAQAAALAHIATTHDGLDGQEQQAVPLSDPGVMEQHRRDWAKRQAIYGKDAFPDLLEKPQ